LHLAVWFAMRHQQRVLTELNAMTFVPHCADTY
jgi:hypothetical protein